MLARAGLRQVQESGFPQPTIPRDAGTPWLTTDPYGGQASQTVQPSSDEDMWDQPSPADPNSAPPGQEYPAQEGRTEGGSGSTTSTNRRGGLRAGPNKVGLSKPARRLTRKSPMPGARR